MEATELIEKLLEMNGGVVEMALDGLPDGKLNEAPNTDCNPIGWLLWHRARVEDAAIARVTGVSQIWVDSGWAGKFGMEASPDNMGFGNPPEDVRSMNFTRENLVGYAKAVREKTKTALQSLSPEDLDKEIPDLVPGQTIRAGELLGRAILLDNFQHSGQVAYLRGYYTGHGWLPF
jgi:hypothetical protein